MFADIAAYVTTRSHFLSGAARPHARRFKETTSGREAEVRSEVVETCDITSSGVVVRRRRPSHVASVGAAGGPLGRCAAATGLSGGVAVVPHRTPVGCAVAHARSAAAGFCRAAAAATALQQGRGSLVEAGENREIGERCLST